MSARGGTKHIYRVKRPGLFREQALRPRKRGRAQEAHPYRSAGQSKRRAHSRRRSQLWFGSASGPPTAKDLQVAFRMSAGPGENPIKATGSGTMTQGDLTGSLPQRFTSCSLRQRVRPPLAWRGCPSSAPRSPHRAGMVRRQSIGNFLLLQPNVYFPPPFRGNNRLLRRSDLTYGPRSRTEPRRTPPSW